MDDEKRHGVFVVSNIPLLIEGIRATVEGEEDLFVSGTARGVPDVIPMVAEAQPDLVLLDIQLAGGTGLDIAKRLKAKDDSIRILLVSVFDEALYADRGIRAGALGYVNKFASPEDLIAAIRTALEGNIYLSDAMEQRLLGKLVGADDATPEPIEQLTDRELEVFQFLSDGFTIREIASKMSVSIKTVDTYRENIKGKLGLKSSHELNRFAVQWQLENS